MAWLYIPPWYYCAMVSYVLLSIEFVFIVIKNISQCWPLYPNFRHFKLVLCLGFFWSQFVFYIMELYVTVTHVGCLDSYETRFNPPYSTKRNACNKLGIQQLIFILQRFWFWFYHFYLTHRFEFPLLFGFFVPFFVLY